MKRPTISTFVVVAVLVGLSACSSASTQLSSTTPASAATESSVPNVDVGSPPLATSGNTAASVHTDSTPPTTELSPTAFALIEQGPYKVGVQTITITDTARDRPLTVDVWFPIRDDVEGKPFEYTLFAGNYYRSPNAIGATPADIAGNGPFPLVVYSHGSGGLRYVASFNTEALASHGYIVAAPDHTGNTAIDRLSNGGTTFEVTAWNRPNDVRAVIDAMTDPASLEAGAFASLVDAERIAVSGHSFGGFTALAMAAGYTSDLGDFTPDPRVDAVIAMAPATGDGSGRLFSDENLADIAVPTMLIVGQDDKTTPIEPNINRPWALAHARPFYRIELVAAEHQSFTDVCDYKDFLATLPDALPLIVDTVETLGVEGCSATDMPIERAKELTNTFTVQFLETIFRDGPPINPDTTTMPPDVVVLVK